MSINLGKPKITIGIPVYNGAKTIGRTITSILRQDFRDFKAIISDNASTDETSNICIDLQKTDSRIEYLRQHENIGGIENFRFLLSQAQTELFVFLAADDYWESNFLNITIEALDSNSNAIASLSRVIFEKENSYCMESTGTFGIYGNVLSRLRQFINCPSDNSRFYGIFRTHTLKKAFHFKTNFYALDWYIMALTLLEGEHIFSENTLIHREASEPSKYYNSIPNLNKNFMDRNFPLLPMSIALLGSIESCLWLFLLPPLIRLNLGYHKDYLAYKYPLSNYAKFLSIITKVSRKIKSYILTH